MNGRKAKNQVLGEVGKTIGVSFLTQRNGWFLDGKPIWQTKAIDENGNTALMTDNRLKKAHICFNGITTTESEEKTASFLMKAGNTIEVSVQPYYTLQERWRSPGFSTVEELRMKTVLQGGNQT